MGRVAAGADIGFLSKTFHDFADPQRSAQSPQAESVVEALQTQLWRGAFDVVAFDYGVETACAMRGVPGGASFPQSARPPAGVTASTVCQRLSRAIGHAVAASVRR